MRHGKKFNHLSRKAAHRDALLSNMTNSLIEHKRISTTVAKAKALRKYIEPIITKAKNDSTHNRRSVFSLLQSKEAIKVLFDEISPKVGQRPGGYTRIIKLGKRLGDSADMCIIELVDFNELLLEEDKPKKSSSRRRRSRGKKSSSASTAEKSATDTKAKEAAPKDTTPKTDEAKPEEAKADKKSEKEEPVAKKAKEEKPAEPKAEDKPSSEASDDATDTEDKKKNDE